MFNINQILEQAVEKEASDVHLILESKPMCRVGNVLVKMEGVPVLKEKDMYEIYNYMINGNNIKDKVFQNTKKLDMIYNYNGNNFGVNISSSNQIPTYTIKILNNEFSTYEQLNLPDILRKMTYNKQGIILVTGQRNSGKTTTVNALVRHINETQNKKILMLENCIEYNHKSRNSIIIQKEIENDYETYYDGIKNAIKEDCDVLVVEEIYDRKTMEAIFEVAEAGILVIGSMNTLTPSKTLEKIKSFYSEKEQSQVEYSIKNLIKVIDSQRIIEGKKDEKELVSEVLVLGRKQENISLIESVAKLYIENKITLKQAKAQLEKSEIDEFNNKIMKMRIFQKKVNV